MKPKSKNPTASSPKSAKKRTKTSKPACAKSAKATCQRNASAKPSVAREALGGVTELLRLLHISKIATELTGQYEDIVLIPEAVFNAVLQGYESLQTQLENQVENE
jgi:hypothetical protein